MTTTVTAADNAPKVLISQSGRKGDPGTDGTNGNGFNQVRKSLLDNPLCHLFKTNKLVDTSAPTNTDADVTWNRSTSATYVDRYGTVRTAAINTPREEKEGFLIEGASTNLTLYSSDITQSATWQDPGNTWSVVGNNIISPDGTSNADNITIDILNPLIRVITSTGLAAGTYTISFWAKTTFGQITGGTVDLHDVGTGDTTPSLSTISLEWQRFQRTITNSNISTFWDISLFTPTVGSQISIWGAQVEKSPVASSYIPTVASPVTRTADAVSVQVNNNSAQLDRAMSIAMNVNITNQSNAAIILFSPTLGVTSAAFRTYVDVPSGVNVNQFGNSAINVGSFPLSQNVNHTITYDNASMVIYRDGASPVSASYVAPTSFLDISSEIRLGSDTFGNSMFGHIKDFRTYDFKLNANEVEYLSA